MKCPMDNCTAKLIELNPESEDYEKGYNHKCMKCKKFFLIVGDDFGDN